jgi:hypothetical protein
LKPAAVCSPLRKAGTAAPSAAPVREPEEVGATIERLVSESRLNMAVNGKNLATPWEP